MHTCERLADCRNEFVIFNACETTLLVPLLGTFVVRRDSDVVVNRGSKKFAHVWIHLWIVNRCPAAECTFVLCWSMQCRLLYGRMCELLHLHQEHCGMNYCSYHWFHVVITVSAAVLYGKVRRQTVPGDAGLIDHTCSGTTPHGHLTTTVTLSQSQIVLHRIGR